MSHKRNWELNTKQQAIFNNLWNQVIAIFNYTNHQQGFRGIERYRNGLRAFCKHLAIHYRPKNFRNIQDKHLISFIEESVAANVDITTLKTDLSAIRKLHKLTPKTRYKLTVGNDLLGVAKRTKKVIERAWSENEYHAAINLALSMNRNDVVWALKLARYCGVRLEECTALTKTQLKEALHHDFLSLKNTKNGILRDIPLNQKARLIISSILKEAISERFFVYHGRNHQQAKKSIQNWIINNRSKFAEQVDNWHNQLNDTTYRSKLTFHGLRHAFARERYQDFIRKGFSPQTSRKMVAEQMGHGRDDVTLIYLGSVITNVDNE
ncbi:site-specific integrase [Caldibacillus thermolactis]|uniref:Site-specific integrase n=1 Tax=Pallidibacillus thermolactis TaxID=251051 RepID=A0ABT2WJB2_9BACI|nr:site-specific integrase [Pallidibacillus thermolactis]MCU9595778.1 site-specific integrase [Pallidibacillus thermolactis]